MLSLSASVAAGFRKPFRPVFVLNHAGLFLVLAALGLGAADRESHYMTVFEGNVEWRADASDAVAAGLEEPEALPIALRLDDFDVEEYPARLALIDRASGVPLPEGRPAYRGLDGTEGGQGLPGWELEILQYLPRAAPAGGGAFARAVMKASAQAALVRARPAGGAGGGPAGDAGGEPSGVTGWITHGNAMVPPAYLALGADRLLVMTSPEPRRFVSKVKAFTMEGLEVERTVEVNSPLTAGPWRVYQYAYDTGLGRLSPWSRFLLVKDRWRPVSRAGFVLWLLGSAGLVLSGRRAAPAGAGAEGPARARRGGGKRVKP
jgi:hypothetical protein